MHLFFEMINPKYLNLLVPFSFFLSSNSRYMTVLCDVVKYSVFSSSCLDRLFYKPLLGSSSCSSNHLHLVLSLPGHMRYSTYIDRRLFLIRTPPPSHLFFRDFNVYWRRFKVMFGTWSSLLTKWTSEFNSMCKFWSDCWICFVLAWPLIFGLGTELS